MTIKSQGPLQAFRGWVPSQNFLRSFVFAGGIKHWKYGKICQIHGLYAEAVGRKGEKWLSWVRMFCSQN